MNYFRKIIDRYGIYLILALGIVLRIAKLRYSYFGPINELARDLIVNYNFVFEKQIPLLGPSASLGGFNFGAFYYYLMAPFLWLSNYYAWGAVALSTFFSILQILLIYLLVKLWFENKKVALVSAFISAICMVDIQNAYYVSNPNPMPFFLLLFFYSLTLIIQGRYLLLNSIIAGLSLGLVTQLHGTALLIIPLCYLVVLFIYRRRIRVKFIILTILTAAFTY
ncbi:MAG: glycosyltransferase family 39 protein, partial [Candidatus Doudnabacteria bacterium]|nr:glycosyltransferase family 39 protein [Candidatus Doudnabacteria bacterium]